MFSLVGCKEALVEAEAEADGSATNLAAIDSTLVPFESIHSECDLSANIVGEASFNFREYIEPNFFCSSSGYGKKVSAGAHMYVKGVKLDEAPLQIEVEFVDAVTPVDMGLREVTRIDVIRGGFGYPL